MSEHAPVAGAGPATGLAGALEGEMEKLSHCVHCGFCLSACPTYVRLGDEADSPRGRLYLMRAVVEGRLDPGSSAFQTHIDRCLGCRACEPVCPSGVEYGFLLERARQAATEAREPSVSTRALLGVMGNSVLEPVFMAASRLFRATGLPALGARVLPRAGFFGQLKLGLGMLAASSRVRFENGPDSEGTKESPADASPSTHRSVSPASGGASSLPRSAGATPAPAPSGRGRVVVLTGCVQGGLFGRVNRATVRVLEANGFEVVAFEGQGCCGALHAHGGDLERARELARANIVAMEASGADRLVVNAAGCGSALEDYGALLEDEPEWRDRARRLAGSVEDVTEILAGAGEGAGPRRGGALPLKVAYDAPCHLVHAQRVAEPPRAVLSSIPGLELVPLENAEECCGGAGIYGITHPDLGGRIGSDKIRAIEESGAQVVATGNPGCIMQIGAGLRMAGIGVGVLHPVELLDESYRRGGVYE